MDEKLDGEGAFTVCGRLLPVEDSMTVEGLPIRLAHGFRLKRPVKQDQRLSWQDIEYTKCAQAVAVRKEMGAMLMGFQSNKASDTGTPSKVNGLGGVDGAAVASV